MKKSEVLKKLESKPDYSIYQKIKKALLSSSTPLDFFKSLESIEYEEFWRRRIEAPISLDDSLVREFKKLFLDLILAAVEWEDE